MMFRMPSDVDPDEFGRLFERPPEFADYLLSEDNFAPCYRQWRGLIMSWHSGAQTIVSYQWRALGHQFAADFADLIDWQQAKRIYGFEYEMLFTEAVFQAAGRILDS